MGSELVTSVDAISALAAVYMIYLTWRPCKSSGVSYLLGIPAGFALIATAFITMVFGSVAFSNLHVIGFLTGIVSLLTQTYGLLFLSLTYARRTRLRFVGESTSIELAIPSVVTVAVVASFLTYGPLTSPDALPKSMEPSLRIVMSLAALYLAYETERNWSLTRRASEGVVTVGFVLLFFEQLGFILAQNLGDVAVFVGYEGRLLGLFLLIAVVSVGIKKGDFRASLKRLGLIVPAH